MYCRSSIISQSNTLKPRLLLEITVLEKWHKMHFHVSTVRKVAIVLFELLFSCQSFQSIIWNSLRSLQDNAYISATQNILSTNSHAKAILSLQTRSQTDVSNIYIFSEKQFPKAKRQVWNTFLFCYVDMVTAQHFITEVFLAAIFIQQSDKFKVI